MKKLLISLICLLTCFMLTACKHLENKNEDTKQNEVIQQEVIQQKMIIQQSQLSDESNILLNLFDEDIHLYDLSIDETAKSYKISLWGCIDNDWNELTYTSDNIEKGRYRLGIRVCDNKYNLIIVKNNEIRDKVSSEFQEIQFGESLGTYSYQLENPMEIELNQEITLVLKVSFDSTQFEVPDNFREAKCKSGFAVVFTLSDKAVE